MLIKSQKLLTNRNCPKQLMFLHRAGAPSVHGLAYSAIHKATGRRQERPQRPFPYSRLQGFSVIVPGKAGNSSAGGFVNSAVITVQVAL